MYVFHICSIWICSPQLKLASTTRRSQRSHYQQPAVTSSWKRISRNLPESPGISRNLPESPGISRPPAHAAILPSSLPPPGGLEHECCNLKPWYAMICHDMPWYAMICHDMPWYAMMWHDVAWYLWYQQLKSVMSVMCFVGSTCQQVKGLGGSLGSVGNLSQIKIMKVNNHLAM